MNIGNQRASASRKDVNAALSPELLFYFHVGPVWAVASKGDLIATGGDDKWVSGRSHYLFGHYIMNRPICNRFVSGALNRTGLLADSSRTGP